MEEAAAEMWILRRRRRKPGILGLYICAVCQYLYWGNWKWDQING